MSDPEMDSDPETAGSDLLQQLELILDRDKLIDEVGFVHPSQFAALNEQDSLCSPADVILEYDKTVFWNSRHKLAISVDVLPQLYNAALHAYKNANTGDSEILKHTKVLLILSCDYLSAWNSRKLVLSNQQDLSSFMDEFQLSTVILSYAPKSENAWSHRRWLIKEIANKFQNLEWIIGKESELVEKIAEKSKMNYRAWNHRCWLVRYMTMSQVLDELNKSRKWAELYVADSSCFHYRRRLMLKMLEEKFAKQDGGALFTFSSHAYISWKEELQWNELLIERYIGREALWVHRRFLSQCWINHFAYQQERFGLILEAQHHASPALDDFLGKEMQLLQTCLNTVPDEFDDSLAQAQHAASYIVWISKQISHSDESKLQERLREVGDLKAILVKTCPEKRLLWEGLLD